MDKKRNIARTAVMALCALVILGGAAVFGLHATSRQEFCMACHEMKPQAREQLLSSHAKDAEGRPITCAQCHIPPGHGPRYLAVKIYSGVKDVFVHYRDKPDSLNRARLQPLARRFIDDANCRGCHTDLYKDAGGQGEVSGLGRMAHDAYLGKNGQAASKCTGCHINLAHLPAFDRRLDINKDFSLRMQNEEGVR